MALLLSPPLSGLRFCSSDFNRWIR